ncbi:MAG: hypothetical protein QW096_13210 [Thermofilaceae archaeon]
MNNVLIVSERWWPDGTGALLVRFEVFEEVGSFNENLGCPRTIYEDLEYVMRIRKAGDGS